MESVSDRNKAITLISGCLFSVLLMAEYAEYLYETWIEVGIEDLFDCPEFWFLFF